MCSAARNPGGMINDFSAPANLVNPGVAVLDILQVNLTVAVTAV